MAIVSILFVLGYARTSVHTSCQR